MFRLSKSSEKSVVVERDDLARGAAAAGVRARLAPAGRVAPLAPILVTPPGALAPAGCAALWLTICAGSCGATGVLGATPLHERSVLAGWPVRAATFDLRPASERPSAGTRAPTTSGWPSRQATTWPLDARNTTYIWPGANCGASSTGMLTLPTEPPGTVMAMVRGASPLSTSYTARRTSVTIVPLAAQVAPDGSVQRDAVAVALATTTVAEVSVSLSADMRSTRPDAGPAASSVAHAVAASSVSVTEILRNLRTLWTTGDLMV